MSDFFKPISSDFNVKKISKMTDPVIYDPGMCDYVCLLERPIKDRELDNIKKFLNTYLKGSYKLISVLPYEEKSEDIKRVVDTYTLDSIDLKKYVTPNSKVFTFGRAIYAITKSDVLNIDSFHDFIFNKTYFWSPDLQSTIYPCHSFDITIGQKTFERFFTIKQFSFAQEVPAINSKRVSGVIINSTEEFNTLLDDNVNATKIAIDTETSSLDFYTNVIDCMQIAFGPNKGYFIPWEFVNKRKFSQFLKDKFQVYANGKFDTKCLIRKGISRSSLHIDFDTLQAGHALNEMRSNSLKAHSWLYTVYGGYESELKAYVKKNKIKSYSKIPPEILNKYAWMDAVATFQVYEQMNEQITWIDENFPMTNGWSLRRYYEEIMLPTVNMFVDIEYGGIFISVEELQRSSEELDIKLKKLKEDFYSLIGLRESDVSITSPKALGELFKERGLPSLGDEYIAAGGYYLTNDDCLEKWSKMGYKEAQIVSEFRKVDIIQKTFIGRKHENSGMWQYIKQYEDGSYRINPTFWVMLADSGRGRSSDPNLQNIPVHGEHAKLSRRHYTVPAPNFNFMSSDFSGLQLRIAAMLSKDKNMFEAFTKLGGDLHSMTAVTALLGNKIPLDEFMRRKKDPEWKDWVKGWRLKAKNCNFGMLFGKITMTVMTGDIMPYWTEKECKDFIKDNKLKTLELNGQKDVYYTVADYVRTEFFNSYPALEQWHKDTREFAVKNGYVRSPHGVIRRLPELLYSEDQNRKRTAGHLNICLNSPVQAMESAIVMRTMVNFYNWAKENNKLSRFFAYVHDAVEMYVPDSELHSARVKFIEFATHQYPEYEGIPLEVEGNVADPRQGQIWDFGEDWNDF